VTSISVFRLGVFAMNEMFSPEKQVEALLDMLDELDPWTSKFVQGLNEWVQRGRRLTERQREVLQDKFETYDPLWLNERRRWDATHELLGKFVTDREAIGLLKDRLATLDAADARFMHRVMLLSADGGGVTEASGQGRRTRRKPQGRWPSSSSSKAGCIRRRTATAPQGATWWPQTLNGRWRASPVVCKGRSAPNLNRPASGTGAPWVSERKGWVWPRRAGLCCGASASPRRPGPEC
jgi:hypothetical protein